MAAREIHTGEIVQFRKGGDVLLARTLNVKQGKLFGVGEDGKKVDLPADRVLQAAGTIPGSPADADVKARLREVRAEAEALVPGVDLSLLWEMAKESPEGGPVDALVSLYFGRSGAAPERLAFGFALCSDRQFFRQKGEAFVPRSEKEVREAQERREQERRAAERRAAFLAWVKARLEAAEKRRGAPQAETGEAVALADAPEGAAAEVAAIVDLAVRGDEAQQGVRARTLLKEIAEATGRAERPRYGPHGDGAFDCLVALGVFEEHENLALRRVGLPQAYPAELVAAANALPAFDPGQDGARRTRLPEGVPAVTIDDAETTDRDDAISLEALPDGGHRLGIHIADVAHFVARGTPLDDEAQRRGTTVYLPRGKLPMFPPVLSEGRMSLDTDGAARPVLSFYATLSPELDVVREEVAEGVISVSRNLTYDDVDAAIEGRPLERPYEHAALLDRIGRRLLETRMAGGAVELKQPEIKLVVDDAGRVTLKRIEARSPSRALVAEMMILANGIAARTCVQHGIPAIFRRQAGPADPAPPLESCPSPEVWAFEVRRRLARTELGAEPGRHYTLGLDAYLQATSPIRRYQDLVVERQLKAHVRGEPLPYSHDEVLALAGNAEATSGDSVIVERETNQYWLLRWLLARRGEPMEAVVLQDRDGRYLVELVESVYRTVVRGRGRWEPGQRVWVRVDGGNPRRGEITLSACAPPKAPDAPADEAPPEGDHISSEISGSPPAS